jgi:acyl-CoA synthetase (NDP forming)
MSQSASAALDHIFHARSVAVVGASSNPTKFGYMTLETLVRAGYDGAIYPVNPSVERHHGLRVYPSVADIPGEIDLAVVIVAAPDVPGILREAAAKGAKGAVILSAGFRESGFPEREAELAAASRETGLRFLGPNIQGINYVPNRLCAMFFPVITKQGPIAVISQSGTVTAALSEWAEDEGLGISAAVNLGNQVDMCEADVLDYFAQDDCTQAIALYLEGIKDGARFLDAARRVTPVKPIVVLKAGRSETGRRSAASHTGSLAGNDGVFSGACRQFGLVRADDLESLYDASKALATLKPRGPRLLVVSTSGGGNTLAVDEAERRGLALPPLPAPYAAKVRELKLPANASVANPLDLAGINASHFEQAIRQADENDVADVYLIVFGDPVQGSTDAVRRMSASIRGSLAVAYFGGGSIEKASRVEIQSAGVPVFPTPERAIRGIAAAVWASQHQRE